MARSRSSRQETFVDRFADVAFAVQQATGIRAEVVLGQAALETGWGKSKVGNNMLGIKGPGVVATTKEDYGTGLKSTKESFRSFNRPEDSFAAYGDFMGRMGRYDAARTAPTVADQVAAIGRSGYATDRDYGSKLAGVVDAIQGTKAFQDAAIGFAVGMPDVPEAIDPESFDGLDADPIGPSAPPVGDVEFGGFLDAPPAALSLSDFVGAAPAGFGIAPDALGFADTFGIAPGNIATPVSADFDGMFQGTVPDSPVSMSDFVGAAPASMSIDPMGPLGIGSALGITPEPSLSLSDFVGAAPVDMSISPMDMSTPDSIVAEQDRANRVADFERSFNPHTVENPAPNIDKMNAALMAELAPATPAPSVSSRSAMGDIEAEEEIAPSSFAPSLPSTTAPSIPDAPDFDGVFGATSLPSLVGAPMPSLAAAPAPVAQSISRPTAAARVAAPVTTAAIRATPAQVSAAPAAPVGQYAGFASPLDAMGAIATGKASMPEGFNTGWGSKAFGDGPYATVAHNELMDAVAAEMGAPTSKSLSQGFKEATGFDLGKAAKDAAIGGMIGGPVGMAAGGLLGGVGLGLSSLDLGLPSMADLGLPSALTSWGGLMSALGIGGGYAPGFGPGSFVGFDPFGDTYDRFGNYTGGASGGSWGGYTPDAGAFDSYGMDGFEGTFGSGFSGLSDGGGGFSGTQGSDPSGRGGLY